MNALQSYGVPRTPTKLDLQLSYDKKKRINGDGSPEGNISAAPGGNSLGTSNNALGSSNVGNALAGMVEGAVSKGIDASSGLPIGGALYSLGRSAIDGTMMDQPTATAFDVGGKFLGGILGGMLAGPAGAAGFSKLGGNIGLGIADLAGIRNNENFLDFLEDEYGNKPGVQRTSQRNLSSWSDAMDSDAQTAGDPGNVDASTRGDFGESGSQGGIGGLGDNEGYA